MVTRGMTFGSRTSPSVPTGGQNQDKRRLRHRLGLVRARHRNHPCACAPTGRPTTDAMSAKPPLLPK
ncbi:hypothetical protein CSC88_26495, partial [Klebsiella pneumoniae]